MSHPRERQEEGSYTKSEPYASLSLQGHGNSIRLLDLSPGRESDRLHGTLRTVSLDPRPAFSALSYTWGASTEGNSIYINKLYNISVTDNLSRALKRLRSRIKKRTLWIDAICIDQADVGERGRQVSIMGSIYRSATSVLVWLGEYPNSSSLDPLHMRPPHIQKPTLLVRRFQFQLSPGFLPSPRGRKIATALDKAICDSNPKWSDRVWIVQEFVMAQRVFLCFGSIRMRYDEDQYPDMFALSRSPRVLPQLSAFQRKTMDMASLKRRNDEKSPSISEAAFAISASSCWDPKDKVFGLLSLIDKNEARLIEPEYNQPCAEIYAKATFAAIQAESDFTMLELVIFCRPPMDGLPSWAVNFTFEQNVGIGRVYPQLQHPIRWPVPKSISLNSVALDSGSKLLTATGAPLDRVKRLFRMLDVRVIGTGSLWAKLGVDLTHFLEALFRQRDLIIVKADVQQKAAEFLQPSLLLMGDDRPQRTRVRRPRTIVNAAFAIWDDLVYADKRNSSARKPFWERDPHEWVADLTVWHPELYLEYAAFVGGGATFFTTANDRVGIGPSSLELNDELVLLVNCKLPVILRKCDDRYLFRGFAWVHGIGDGELLDKWNDLATRERHYVLC